jgi:hypothetical protein
MNSYTPVTEQSIDTLLEVQPPRSTPLEAGMVLGIHNIYIVIPQFISTLISSIIFSFVSEEKYVLFTGGIALFCAGSMALRMDKQCKFTE